MFALPFVIEVEELREVKKIAARQGCDGVKLGVFVETPAAVFDLPAMAAEGISYVCIGTKDLTQMILACDRGNKRVAHLYDAKKPAVKRAIEQVVQVCKDLQLPVYVTAALTDANHFIAQLPSINKFSFSCAEYLKLQ